jgi:steroid 5-alpha reductase family enzyme
MTGLWFVQRRTGNAGIVDAAWAASIGFLAVFFAATSDGDPLYRIVVALLAGIWALRLSLYIFTDRILNKPEEGRYVTLRKKWGDNAGRRFFIFYQYQAFFALFFSLPMLVVAHRPDGSRGLWVLPGVLIWIVSVGNTILSDRQLARFRADPGNRGKTCRSGWWRTSRHPNYFFEWLHWWSYVALALAAPYWWVTLLAPGMMLYLLLRVTGIPPTEAQALASRGDDYREYQRSTSMFVPWFPLKGSKSR